jgi:hypothetical protein
MLERDAEFVAGSVARFRTFHCFRRNCQTNKFSFRERTSRGPPNISINNSVALATFPQKKCTFTFKAILISELDEEANPYYFFNSIIIPSEWRSTQAFHSLEPTS